MYANVITTRYKSPEDLEAAIGKLAELVPEVAKAPGFKAVYFVRTGEAKTTHTALFDSRENAEATRKKMLPRFQEIVGPHLAEDPTVEPGEVVLST